MTDPSIIDDVTQGTEQPTRDEYGRFLPGVSGNPGGRPRGRRRVGPELTLQELHLYYSQKHAADRWGDRLASAILLERLAMDEARDALAVKYQIKDLRRVGRDRPARVRAARGDAAMVKTCRRRSR